MSEETIEHLIDATVLGVVMIATVVTYIVTGTAPDFLRMSIAFLIGLPVQRPKVADKSRNAGD